MRDDATAGIQQGQKQPTHQETAQLVVTIVWVGLGRGLGHCLRLDWPTNHTPSKQRQDGQEQGWFVSFNGMAGLRPCSHGLGVGERSLNDSTHRTHRARGEHRARVW